MADKYVKKYIEAIKNCVSDDDLKVVINRIYEDGFEDSKNEQPEERILMARKPVGIQDVKNQVSGRITPAEQSELAKDEKCEEKCFTDWDELMKADLSSHRFWKIQLRKEDELLLVDTSGYDYPRYVGLLERESDKLPLKEKIEAYKDHFFVMMNDLSKDELIQQLWDMKPYEEKKDEAIKFSRTLDW
ncbi:MAG: hypothetical protein D6732_15155 [Methanobacteriota archaeon]|nr:MAG: hypothetical protein D6732_15155 [Euryarchaeota archaeon]